MSDPANDTLDFGSGYTGRWIGWYPDRELNPQYDGFDDVEKALLMIRCPHSESGCQINHPELPEGHPYRERDGWTVEQWEPLTLSPSIQSRQCACHGYIRDGRWQDA